MSRFSVLCLFLITSLHLSAQEKNVELVYTARVHLEKAQELMQANQFDSALIHCDWALEKAPSYRETYIIKHKLYEGMKAESSVKIENIKAAQKISLEDEELAYYLGQIYQKEDRLSDAIVEYSNAITYSKVNDGDLNFRYYYYMGRGASYLKSRNYQKGIADFTDALEIDPKSTGALLNRGFCYYNTKDKNKACVDWRQAGKLGNKSAEGYIGKYCF